jgi:hypothetical protein
MARSRRRCRYWRSGSWDRRAGLGVVPWPQLRTERETPENTERRTGARPGSGQEVAGRHGPAALVGPEIRSATGGVAEGGADATASSGDGTEHWEQGTDGQRARQLAELTIPLSMNRRWVKSADVRVPRNTVTSGRDPVA